MIGLAALSCLLLLPAATGQAHPDLDALFDNALPRGDSDTAPRAGESFKPYPSASGDPAPPPPASPFADPARRRRLLERAKEVLEYNRERFEHQGRTHEFTVPDKRLYPYQWLWDSVFHAMGIRHYDVGRARAELETLLAGQHADGLLPHMLQLHPEQLRARAVARLGRTLRRFDIPGAFAAAGAALRFSLEPLYMRAAYPGYDKTHSSHLTQSPVAAEGAAAVAESLGGAEGKHFLESVFPKLYAYYEWLHRERDVDKDGLITIYNSVETGTDDNSRWDLVYGVQPGGRITWKENLGLTLRQRLFGAKSSFEAKAVDMSSYYYQNLKVLAQIAQTLGKDREARILLARAAQTRESILNKMWDDQAGIFVDLAKIDGKETPLRVLTPFGAIPLYAGILDPNDTRVPRLLEPFSDPTRLQAPYGIPSVSRSDPSFEAQRYWRGTSWINVNYFIARAMLQYGRNAEARNLIYQAFEMVERGGFREYFNAETGTGYGGNPYSWTASLLFELEALLEQAEKAA